MAYGLQWNIRFNPVKSQIACFGGKSPGSDCISIGGKIINWSDRIKYLGCYFRSGRTEVDPLGCVGKFYGAFNNILNVLGTRRDEMLAVHLAKTYCLPSLLYSCETWRLNNTDAKSIDAAWNNAFRKNFNGYWRESVKLLQLFYCKCLPASVLIDIRKILFWRKMFYHSNVILHNIAVECRQSVAAVADSYNITIYDIVHCNNFMLRNMFWLKFGCSLGLG